MAVCICPAMCSTLPSHESANDRLCLLFMGDFTGRDCCVVTVSKPRGDKHMTPGQSYITFIGDRGTGWATS